MLLKLDEQTWKRFHIEIIVDMHQNKCPIAMTRDGWTVRRVAVKNTIVLKNGFCEVGSVLLQEQILRFSLQVKADGVALMQRRNVTHEGHVMISLTLDYDPFVCVGVDA